MLLQCAKLQLSAHPLYQAPRPFNFPNRKRKFLGFWR